MTREEMKKLLPIIQAWVDGKTIQVWTNDTWVDKEYPCFFEELSQFRIKPESKYRPFKTQKECWEEMHKHLNFGWIRYGDFICTIQTIAPDGIAISDGLEINNFDFKECFMNTKFVDDTPFGIKEQ